METKKENGTNNVETKPMSLEDLGLEDETTPAQKSEELAKKTHASKIIERSDGVKVEQKDFIDPNDAIEKPKMSIPRPENVKTIKHAPQQHSKNNPPAKAPVNGKQKEDANKMGPALKDYTEKQIMEERKAVEELQKNATDAIQMQGLTRGDDSQSDGEMEFISNVNSIAKNPIKKPENPIKKTWNKLGELADKGIDRTKKELTAPGGRIDEAKEKYIAYKYESLMKRAQVSPNLKKKIDYYQQIMDTDPSFDGATEYMRKGYILFKVAKDDSIGITDKSFGLAQETIRGNRANSADNDKKMQKIMNNANESNDTEDKFVVGDTVRSDDIPVRKSTKEDDFSSSSNTTYNIDPAVTLEDDIPIKKQTRSSNSKDLVFGDPSFETDLSVSTSNNAQDNTIPSTNEVKSPTIEGGVSPTTDDLFDDEKILNGANTTTTISNAEVVTSEVERGLVSLNDDTVDPDISLDEMDDNTAKLSEDSEFMKVYGITEESYRKMEMDYLKDAARLFNIAGNDEDTSLSNLTEGKAINLNTALKLSMQQSKPDATYRIKSTWPLMFTGIPAITTAFSGQELIQFTDALQVGFYPSRDNPNPSPTLAQLRDVFSALYEHFANPGRPDFDTWLRRISSMDFYDLIFSQYNAQFSHNNYLSYQCPKYGCAKLFLEKKPIMDMIVFPSDKAKERFNAILRKDSVVTNLYRTEPVAISDSLAMSFRTPSIYSMSFEIASLPKNIREKYSTITIFLPMLDALWAIDHRNNQKHRIDFGVVKNDLEKTTMRKLNGILKIMTMVNIDQRSKIYAEYLKILNSLNTEALQYQIPETKCPVCGTHIEAEQTDPLTALFIRARLSIEAASIPALR